MFAGLKMGCKKRPLDVKRKEIRNRGLGRIREEDSREFFQFFFCPHQVVAWTGAGVGAGGFRAYTTVLEKIKEC